MSEFKPCTDMQTMLSMDQDAMVAGYRSGYSGGAAPGSSHCRGFHHGYANGLVDSGRAKISPEQSAFAVAYVDASRVRH